jgi:hypothetical protein
MVHTSGKMLASYRHEPCVVVSIHYIVAQCNLALAVHSTNGRPQKSLDDVGDDVKGADIKCFTHPSIADRQNTGHHTLYEVQFILVDSVIM